jgi:3-hydroxymyristoyl/3-hydroxydecanoyl-(acyl carrier protein) dehydratase
LQNGDSPAKVRRARRVTADMDGHFRAFSFVDRITSDKPGAQIRGWYEIPSRLESFSLALVAEATGQLAAWSAMAALDFKVRPVAGIAASVELLAPVHPGQRIELAADLDSVDADAVSYCGIARADGIPVMKLNHCVGPMLPQEDFDDTQAVKNRYALLCESGATPGAFGGVPEIYFQNITREPGQWIRATLPIPASAPFFLDHFPRRPVFPGTLFMHEVLELTGDLAATIPAPENSKWIARIISDSKLRTFIPPGDSLDFEAKIAKHENNSLLISVEARKGKRVTGSGRVEFHAEKLS